MNFENISRAQLLEITKDAPIFVGGGGSIGLGLSSAVSEQYLSDQGEESG
jgi:hypothetical protein